MKRSPLALRERLRDAAVKHDESQRVVEELRELQAARRTPDPVVYAGDLRRKG